MSVVAIPQHFMLEKSMDDVHIIDYTHKNSVSRQKISCEMYTVSFLLEGVKEIFSSLHSEKINPSNFLLVKRGDCLMTETLSENASYRSKLIFFSKDFLYQFINKYDIKLAHTEDHLQHLYKILPFDNYIKIFLQSIEAPNLSNRMQRAKVEEFLIYCYETYGTALFSFLKDEERYMNMHKTIENHINKDLTVGELAFLCNMSVSTFKRSFYNQYKSTPSKWIKKRRLEMSRIELEHSDVNISAIYLKYGFGSLSSYIHAFKSEYGLTPKQFQKSTL